MNLRIGICGAQGTGKTTLAKAVSEQLDIPYMDAAVGAFLKDIGVDLSNDRMPAIERMKTQLEVAKYIDEITGDNREFITDRTPIDVLAYSMEIALRHHHDDGVIKIFDQIRAVCRKSLFSNLNSIFLLRPGVPLTSEDYKREQRGSLAPFSVQTIDTLMLGCFMDSRSMQNKGMNTMHIISDDTVDLDARIQAVLLGVDMLFEKNLEPCCVLN
ncbi:TPA: AAA family ATPase [Raoultella planticola]